MALFFYFPSLVRSTILKWEVRFSHFLINLKEKVKSYCILDSIFFRSSLCALSHKQIALMTQLNNLHLCHFGVCLKWMKMEL